MRDMDVINVVALLLAMLCMALGLWFVHDLPSTDQLGAMLSFFVMTVLLMVAFDTL